MTSARTSAVPAPEVAGDAATAYAQALSALSATEDDARKGGDPRLERRLLDVTDLVLARRIQAVRALLDSGARLPREEIARLRRDEELLALPRCTHESWLSAEGLLHDAGEPGRLLRSVPPSPR